MLIKMAKVKIVIIPIAGKDAETVNQLYTADGNVKWNIHTWKTDRLLFIILNIPAAAAAKSLQSCPTLCDPIDISPPGSPSPGILQARTLEWVAISFSNAWKWKSESEVAQSCPILSDPMDCSLPGSSIHGIFQARVLKWGAIAFSETYLESSN